MGASKAELQAEALIEAYLKNINGIILCPADKNRANHSRAGPV